MRMTLFRQTIIERRAAKSNDRRGARLQRRR